MECYKCHVGLPANSQFCLSCGEAQNAPAPPVKTDWSKGVGVVMVASGVLILAIIGTLIIGAVIHSAGRSSSSMLPLPIRRVVVNTSEVLRDGQYLSWKLPRGSYELEMTASDDGATVEWIGSDCGDTRPMRQLTTSCRMEREGQLIVRNPTRLGLGASSSVTVKLTQVGL